MKVERTPDPDPEADSVTILKSLWEQQDKTIKISKRVTFFINLIYGIGLVIYCILMLAGYTWAVLPALGLVSIEVFIINALVYSITKSAKKQRDAAYDVYMAYEFKRTNGKR